MQRFDSSDALKRLPDQFFSKLVSKVNKLKREGHDIINLGQGNPDLPTPPHIVDEIKQAVDNPLYYKYPPFQGYDFLKEAIVAFYKREYDVALDPESEVAILFGSKSGLIEVSQCLLNSGDLALLPDPGYPDYMSGIALADAEVASMPLLAENDFLPDYSKLDVETLDKAKLMFLNYPNNPTAGTATDAFFAETVEVAKEHNVCVVHDFAYGALGYDGEKPRSFLQTEGAKDIGIELYTLSKTYNMAGWRVAFAIGNASVIESINLLQEHMFMSLFGGIQQAAEEALLGDQSSVRELVATYERRRDRFVESLHKIGWEVSAPKGTFFAWLPVPNGYSSEQFADLLLEKAHVAVAPGNGFGAAGEGYIRVGLLAPEEQLEQAVERIGKLGIFTSSL